MTDALRELLNAHVKAYQRLRLCDPLTRESVTAYEIFVDSAVRLAKHLEMYPGEFVKEGEEE